MKKTIVNLTPHALRIVNALGELVLEIPPSGEVARVSPTTDIVGEVNDIKVVLTTFGAIEGIPPPEDPDTIYVVSTLVLSALKGQRTDVVSPDTGPDSALRSEDGKIIGVQRFQIF